MLDNNGTLEVSMPLLLPQLSNLTTKRKIFIDDDMQVRARHGSENNKT